MRPLFIFLIFCLAPVTRGADLELVRVWTNYRTANSFVRISEYFTGHEATRNHETILRTDAASRAGFYFLARVKNRGAEISGAQAQVEVITPDAPTPKIFRFPISVPHGSHVYEVGMTGKDWASIDQHPVAWRVLILGADGHPLLSQQSFLWSKPDRS